MKKYLNEKNLNFIAHVATSYEGFNILTAVDLCIDEWYLGNPINEDLKYGGVAKLEFNKLLFGKEYNSIGKTHQSGVMVNSLTEFFNEYIAPKYLLLQKFTYHFLNQLEKNEPEEVYKPGLTDWGYADYKINHSEQIVDLVRDDITDWHFGFALKETLEKEKIEKISKSIEKKVATKKKATTKKSKK
jgi:hypothetical protein